MDGRKGGRARRHPPELPQQDLILIQLTLRLLVLVFPCLPHLPHLEQTFAAAPIPVLLPVSRTSAACVVLMHEVHVGRSEELSDGLVGTDGNLTVNCAEHRVLLRRHVAKQAHVPQAQTKVHQLPILRVT